MIISSRKLVVKQASIEDIIAKVDSMTSEQRDAFAADYVKSHGLRETLGLVQRTLAKLTSSQPKTAQLYDGFKPKPEASPSQLKQRINDAGDWGYLLTLLLLIGTAGAADLGADWGQIFRGFGLTIGAGFLSWCVKKLSSYIK